MSCQAGERKRKTAEKVLNNVGEREEDDRERVRQSVLCVYSTAANSVGDK